MIRLVTFAVLIAATQAHADELSPAVRAQAIRRTSGIAIDGRLDESAWSAAPKHEHFTQRFPNDGEKASYATHFAMLYDDHAVYVGVWAADPEPSKIRRLLTRRDVDAPADSIAVAFDSYFDRRTAYLFQLNAAGVQRDMLLFDDTNGDDTWDAVWTGGTAVNERGWTAEFRIPLNQLRFGSDIKQQWGLQVWRFIGRSKEEATWSPWPRSSDETVSKFGIVDGIRDLKPGRRLELLPYATAGFERMPVEDGDTLNDATTPRGNIGLDLKYGLGAAFTLSAAVNPDFGQVEADPSQVNLSANELFFAEKRQFFLEGVDLFKLPIGNSDNGVEGVFYSRRIGAAPPVEPEDYQYIRMPTATTIYSAAKLTGKTRGWSIGVFDAVTGEEHATIIDADGDRVEPIVAPLTNYAIARVKRDLRGGKTSIGASATAVNRAVDGTGLEHILHDQAYTGGAQISHRWWKNAWQLQLSTVGSLVHGSEEAIARTQRLQRHLYQRPDATNVHFDPTRTSLSGGAVTWKVGRMGDTKHWRYMFGGDLRTAGLELNDAGFQQQSDRLIPFVWAQYHDEKPGDYLLNYQINSDIFWIADEISANPRLLATGLECSANAQFVNHWSMSANCNVLRDKYTPGALRGGPTLRTDPRVNVSWAVETDTRKRVYGYFNFWFGQNRTTDSIDGGLDTGATIQVRSNIDVFAAIGWVWYSESMQYVAEAQDTMGLPHYVFARIRQTTLPVTLRANWTFSPKLSLQVYARPFISAGEYSDFKDITNPGARSFEERFDRLGGRDLVLSDGTYNATNRGARFSFGRPDFNFRELRSTVVLRWEYRPGSNIFAIWSHGRTGATDEGRFDLSSDLRGLGEANSENIVMVKANYWIGL